MKKIIIGIGSSNPAKLQAVRDAVEQAHSILGTAKPIEFRSLEVPSGVASQPFSDEETKQGARNRAAQVLSADPQVDCAFGLEGGVVELDDGLYSTVWITVLDRAGRSAVANGLRFPLPEAIASGIRAGAEMGDVMDSLQKTTGLKHREGMIGVVTGGVVTRAQAYCDLARIVYGLFLAEGATFQA